MLPPHPIADGAHGGQKCAQTVVVVGERVASAGLFGALEPPKVPREALQRPVGKPKERLRRMPGKKSFSERCNDLAAF